MRFLLSLGLFGCLALPAFAQGPLDEDGKLVQFERDIAPIFRDRCLECHGPEDAKNDFRVDDRDLVLGYLVPEEPEYSTMYADYMVTDDEDMLMPPPAHNGPLSPAELALVRQWIAEGASWPEDAEVVATPEPAEAEGSEAEAEASESDVPPPLAERLWAFQGYFHPAAVHFPIALLLVGGLFVLLSLVKPSIGNEVAFSCLVLGAVSAVIASIMGWSLAVQQGYGGWGRGPDAPVFWHRWSGVIVAVLASVFAVIAVLSRRKPKSRWTGVWKLGLLICAGLVGWVGHQGGELTYGKGFYERAFRRLRGGIERVVPEPVEEAVEEAVDA